MKEIFSYLKRNNLVCLITLIDGTMLRVDTVLYVVKDAVKVLTFENPNPISVPFTSILYVNEQEGGKNDN